VRFKVTFAGEEQQILETLPIIDLKITLPHAYPCDRRVMPQVSILSPFYGRFHWQIASVLLADKFREINGMEDGAG